MAWWERATLNELYALSKKEVVRHQPEAATAAPQYRDFRQGDVRHSLADISKSKNLLGYEATYKVDAGLRLAGDWYAANL